MIHEKCFEVFSKSRHFLGTGIKDSWLKEEGEKMKGRKEGTAT